VCAFGCPTSAKQHTGITYLPRAQAAGARVLAQTSVLRIATQGRRFSHVEAIDRDGQPIQIVGGDVIVAAGTIHTPGLLALSGLGGGSGQLGRNLSIHPATAAFALMPELVEMGRGVPQSFYVDEFAGQGILFEGVAGPPSYAAMSLPLKGRRHAEAMSRYPHLAQLGLMVSDSSRGAVRSLGGMAGRVAHAALKAHAPRPVISYRLDDSDLARFRIGLQRLEELFLAAGAKEVYLPLPEGVAPGQARRGDLRLMAFHPLGTARADPSPDRGVVDANLALHGVKGVHVADGSVVPSSLGVNPQLTIMALATRLAFHMLGRPVPGPDLEEIHCPS
jgi:choline dehydrogenase-like flavoprotein